MTEFAPLLLGLALILVAAKLGGELADRLGQSRVVGELCAGILIGNLSLLGIGDLAFLRDQPILDALAQIGVILLLFEVGIESTPAQMVRVGVSAVAVAVIGIIVPSALGFGVSALFFPAQPTYVHLFVGTILAATSVGITARVLRDLGKTQSIEARIILGAAVIDDVLGLIVLAVVAGAVRAADSGTAMSVGAIGLIALKATAFFAISIPLGMFLAPRLFRLAARMRSDNVLLPTSVAFCFVVAYLAHLAGLAPIVGAFTAGLIVEDVHVERLSVKERRTLSELLQPVSSILLPIFFFLIGIKVDLAAFGDATIVLFAAALTVAAVIGKLASAAGVFDRSANRLIVGIGMIPRGEVGFVFAGIGTTLMLKGEPVVDRVVYAGVVLVLMATTLITPGLLRLAYKRRRP